MPGKVEVIDVYDRNPSRFVQHQAAVRHPAAAYIKIKRRFDYVPFSGEYLRATTAAANIAASVPTNELTFVT